MVPQVLECTNLSFHGNPQRTLGGKPLPQLKVSVKKQNLSNSFGFRGLNPKPQTLVFGNVVLGAHGKNHGAYHIQRHASLLLQGGAPGVM